MVFHVKSISIFSAIFLVKPCTFLPLINLKKAWILARFDRPPAGLQSVIRLGTLTGVLAALW